MANTEREEPRDDRGRGQQRRDEPGSNYPGQTGNPSEPGRSDEPGRQGQGSESERNPGRPDSGSRKSGSEESEEESR
ncbi:MAG TPA: hypothetical protein VIB08_08740 [Thermoanaerobaculia bacterium]|jgi:hypothetical protein